MAAVSAVFQAPTQPNFNVASLGPYLLMFTLGAAAFGAFVSIPGALAGGLILGLVSQFTLSETSNGSDAELAIFVVILLVVLLRGRAIASVFALGGGVVDAQPVLRIPEALKKSPLVRFQRKGLAVGAVLLALVFPLLPYFHSTGNQFLLVLVLLYALLGVALTMLIGWAGQVSLGSFALVGLAAYLTTRWGPHWTLPAIILVTGLIGAGVMVVIGLPALRVGGLALAVTTLGFAVISGDWLFRQSWVGSIQSAVPLVPVTLGPGLGTPSSELSIYYIALVMLVLGAAGAGALRRFGPGRLVVAVRDNEVAASSFGINPPAVKLTILAVSGFYAAVCGVLWAEAWRLVSADQFTADVSISIIAIPVIGGLGSIGGAIAAAVILYMVTFFAGPHVSGLFGSIGQNLGFQLFLAGTTQVAVLLYYPKGLAGAVQARWQRFLDRRAGLASGWSPPEHVPLDIHPDEVDRPAPPALDQELTPAHDHFPVTVGLMDASSGEPVPEDEVVPLLVTHGIRVHFGGVVALAGPDIVVNGGEIVGLIGPNGAGKTTLMNVISGVLRPDDGSVLISGREVADLPPDFRAAYGMARTFQDARLFGGLTVTETIQTALAFRQKVGVVSALVSAPWARVTEARSRQAAQRIVERFGLTQWADSLTSELSTGTRRICDLAAQVASKPQLLLLDEPTAGVAQRDAEAFGPLLRRIREELDCSILIVEHDMPLLMGLCDRVYAMEAGRIIADGTPEEVRHNPLVVASYLGTSDTAVSRSGPQQSSRQDVPT
jgi:ABC-type branched-subunit amino acid transport system ATPase component/ABC-type branched-subunit amino acid transport system permease subunit